jgi:hypothetical protein
MLFSIILNVSRLFIVNHFYLIFIFAFLIPSSFYAQQKPPISAQESQLASNQILYRLPFELYGGRIYLRVRVNNSEPRPFLLDSGAQIAHIRSEIVQDLGLKLGGSLGVTGTGTGRIKANYVDGLNYNVSGAQFTNKRSISLPTEDFFQPLENSFGRQFDGVLGYDFFSHFVVEIDYAGQAINLYEPASYHYTGTGDVIPIRINDKKPYITATVTPIQGASFQANLHIDTGSGGGLGFNGNFVAENNLIESAGTTIASFNIGAGGETAARIGRVKSLQFGRLNVANPTVSFALVQGKGVRSDSAGRIGGSLWRRFKVVLDYSRKQMILEPNSNFNVPYNADMSGISLVARNLDNKTFVVYKVLADSPATEAGMSEGDIIISIGDKPIQEFTLEQIREMFRQEGREHLLRVKRGNETLQMRVKLRKLI